jgi:putative endonuclease
LFLLLLLLSLLLLLLHLLLFVLSRPPPKSRHPERSEGPPYFAFAFAVARSPSRPNKPAIPSKRMTPDQAYVYILANTFHHLYTGITTRLQDRVQDHKTAIHPTSFTARYKINRLVYYECYESISQAIAREKQIKGWLRIRKIQLIVANNPTWQDLSLEWGQPAEPFDESKMRPPESF